MANSIDSRIQTDAKDFTGIVQAFFEFARENHRDTWNDENTDQFMRIIAELIAYEGDLLTYYIDKQTSENFTGTAQLRQSIIDLGRMLDYQLRGPEPSSGEVTFSIDVATFDFLTPIPAGFKVSNGEITYETTVETTVAPGSSSVDVPVKEGETIRETVIDLGALGQSDGTPNQIFTLERKNVILSNNLSDLDNDISVLVGGESFSPVFNIVTAQSVDKVYVVNTDENNETTITFGNGVFGSIPPTGVDIEATYRVLLVEREDNNFGNVNAGTVTTLEQQRLGLEDVTNAAKFTGGRDIESIEEARINIPASIKAGDRAVTFEDYRSIAEQFTGVAKARALPGTNPCDLDVDLFIAPEGGGLPSQQLKNDIVAHFEPRRMIRTKIFPRDPIFQPVKINIRTQAEPNNRNVDIQAAQQTALEDLFEFDNMDFGRGVFQKSTGGNDVFDINESLEAVNGVARIIYNIITLKPDIYNKKFDNSGTAELLIECCNTRQGSERREFEIEMVTQTTFRVKSKVFGKSTSLNDTRLEDNLRTFLLEFGESTNVGVSFLQDSNKFFTTNQFQLQTLIDSAGTSFEIASNTQDTITVTSGTPASGDYQIVKRLVGQFLNPNTQQTSSFLITANDSTSATVASGLSEVAVIGDDYEIFRYETNKFDSDALEGSETSGAATATTFTDNVAIGFGDDFFNGFMLIFQEGPAANIPVAVIDYVSATGDFTIDTLGLGNEPNSGDRYVVAPFFQLGKRTTVKAAPPPTTTEFSADGLGGEGDDFYIGYSVHFLTGVNVGLTRRVTDYDDVGNDVLTVNAFPNAPATSDEFQLAREYQTDDQTNTFAIISINPSSTDIYLFQTSELVGDLVPRDNQILTLDSENDLVITVVGGS